MNFKDFLIEHEYFHVRTKEKPPSTVYVDDDIEDEETYDLSASQVEQEPIEVI